MKNKLKITIKKEPKLKITITKPKIIPPHKKKRLV